MARLDKATRDIIGARLEKQLPPHWRVVVGDEGFAFIEVDQDGRRPPHEFHAIGSVVIVVGNSDDGQVEVKRYDRVPHPPGYLEGRKFHSVVARAAGRGWVNTIVAAIVAAVAEADARFTVPVAAEA